MTAPKPITSPWLTVKEAAEYSRRHVNTVTDALRDGSLKGGQSKPGASWRIHRDALDAWINGQTADIQIPAVTGAARSA